MDRGKEFRSVVILRQKGEIVEGEPAQGEFTIEMKPRSTFHGDRMKAIAALEKSYPGCKFAWADQAAKVAPKKPGK